MFGPKRLEVMGELRNVRNEEPHNLYSSPRVIGMVKLMRMSWAGLVARMGRRRMNKCYW
jgi:hypothetical protein